MENNINESKLYAWVRDRRVKLWFAYIDSSSRKVRSVFLHAFVFILAFVEGQICITEASTLSSATLNWAWWRIRLWIKP